MDSKHNEMNTLKRILLWIWQLPQNLLGLAMILCYRIAGREAYGVEDRKTGSYTLVSTRFPGGISLGRYILLRRHTRTRIRHEEGHRKQSLYLGPLYLLIIGLPSLLGNIYDRIFHTPERGWNDRRSYIWYFNQPWEKWADRLGGVER